MITPLNLSTGKCDKRAIAFFNAFLHSVLLSNIIKILWKTVIKLILIVFSANKKTIFSFKKNNIQGQPDGMTIDHEGMVWVTSFGGALVRQFCFVNGLWYCISKLNDNT